MLAVEGTVMARVLVDTAGQCREVRIMNWAHRPLVNKVKKHVMDLTFTPATYNGRKVFIWVTIPFSFVLVDDGPSEDARSRKAKRRAEKRAARNRSRQ